MRDTMELTELLDEVNCNPKGYINSRTPQQHTNRPSYKTPNVATNDLNFIPDPSDREFIKTIGAKLRQLEEDNTDVQIKFDNKFDEWQIWVDGLKKSKSAHHLIHFEKLQHPVEGYKAIKKVGLLPSQSKVGEMSLFLFIKPYHLSEENDTLLKQTQAQGVQPILSNLNQPIQLLQNVPMQPAQTQAVPLPATITTPSQPTPKHRSRRSPSISPPPSRRSRSRAKSTSRSSKRSSVSKSRKSKGRSRSPTKKKRTKSRVNKSEESSSEVDEQSKAGFLERWGITSTK